MVKKNFMLLWSDLPAARAIEISTCRNSSEFEKKVSNCSEETKENCKGNIETSELFREILAGFVESAHQDFLHLRARILATRACRS